jgi:hypothetical protein
VALDDAVVVQGHAVRRQRLAAALQALDAVGMVLGT